MKTRITDLVWDCCPEVLIGEADDARTERILASVQARLGVACRPQRSRRLPRAFLLAAALVLAVGTVAFAITEYAVSHRKPSPEDDLVAGFRYEEVADGRVWNSQMLAFPDAGMVFTFSCPEETITTAEFRCFWLPQAATEGFTDEEGWTKRLFCEAGDSILYSISTIDYLQDGMQLVLNGDVDVVREDTLGDWQILEVTADCKELIYPIYDRANHILLFQKTTGSLILISGELDMEILAHIALELEIRDSGMSRAEITGGPGVGVIDLARG